MHKNKRQSFSKTYSPNRLNHVNPYSKSSILILPHQINRNSTFSKPQIVDILSVEKYKKNRTIQISNERKKKIQKMIDTSQISIAALQKRLNNNDYFVKYKKSLFSNEKRAKTQEYDPKQQIEKIVTPNKNKLKQKAKNIIQGLYILKNRSTLELLKNKSIQFKSQSNTIFNNIVKNRVNGNTKEQFMQYKNKFKTQVQSAQLDAFQFLQSLKIKKEVNYFYFKKQTESINIFSIVRSKKMPIYSFSSQILKKYNFSFDGVYPKTQIPSFQYIHLSSISRQFSKHKINNHKQQHFNSLNANEKNSTINYQTPQFNQLMLIASGRLFYITLFNIMNPEERKIKETTTEIRHQMIQNKMFINEMTLVEKDSSHTIEVDKYKLLQYSELEQRQINLYSKYKNMLQDSIDITKRCFTNNIKDIEYHLNINRKADDLLQLAIGKQIKKRQFSQTQRFYKKDIEVAPSRIETMRSNAVQKMVKMKKQLDAHLSNNKRLSSSTFEKRIFKK